ncbi:phosphomevalonate kinase [Sporolactobacillus sp. STCC-11]|uniref:phosphomevalonate kinase n=1 Tax=Sporolactobacillus caesalpiniae TaxID=3230362 RepID=UPI003390ABAF
MYGVQCAPGKLYIAGEYAVVEPGYPAIIAAVDKSVTVTIERRETCGRIQWVNAKLDLKRSATNQWNTEGDVSPFRFVLSAIERTEQYVQALGKQLGVYQLTISSGLTRTDGRKYGLGSSAAVTVACTKAILAFYEMKIEQQIVFKLAALAHLSVQGNGSCGDIAAGVYGGWIAYTSFDRKWLAAFVSSKKDWLPLLKMDWPKLSIQPLVLPANLHLIVGWTGIPAATAKLIDRVEKARRGQEKGYQHFLKQSKACVEKMIAGFLNPQPELILEGIRENRRILAQLSKLCGVFIETDKLHQLCSIAEKNRGAAKTSGAGGGDCGIVLADQETDQKALIKAWKDHGITPLALYDRER